MSSRGPRTPQQPKKVYYTIGQLAQMADVSEYQMRNHLRSNGVPVGKTGQNARRGVVYISELVRALPQLWDSIQLRRGWDEE